MKEPLLLLVRRLWNLALASTLASSVHAIVTNVAWYRLGENNPSAAVVTYTTTDLAGTDHLTQFGNPPGSSGHHAAALLPPVLAVNFTPTRSAP